MLQPANLRQDNEAQTASSELYCAQLHRSFHLHRLCNKGPV